MPRSPVQELVIAIAGPMVNVVIILVLMVLLVGKTDWGTLESIGLPAGSFLGKILWINVMLVAFNAIPAFPMDGGRVFRALLAMFIDHSKATLIAARAGQVIAVGFGVLGFMGNPMLLLIAMFVFMGAQQELAYAQMRARVDGMRVADVMVTQFATIPDTLRVGQITDVLVRSGQEIFPMVDGMMHFRGLATRDELARAVRELPAGSPASCVARAIPTVPPTGSVAEAVELLQRLDEPVVPVTNASGQLVGLFAVSRREGGA
jgi:CBS domain-containing protein